MARKIDKKISKVSVVDMNEDSAGPVKISLLKK